MTDFRQPQYYSGEHNEAEMSSGRHNSVFVDSFGSVSSGHRSSILGLERKFQSATNINMFRHNYINTSLLEMRPFKLVGNSKPLFEWEKYIKTEEELKGYKKDVRQFYERQNSVIARYIEIDRLLDSGIQVSMLKVYGSDLGRSGSVSLPHATDSTGSLESRFRAVPGNIDEEGAPLLGFNKAENSSIVYFAIMVNFAVNFFLLIAKAAVALLTNSMTVIASLVDSVLDFLSTFIIWLSNRLVENRDTYMYPVGRSRLEPIGVLVFSVIIIVSFLQVGSEALQRLIYNNHAPVVIGVASIVIMLLTIVAKLIIFLWCNSIDSSSVKALAQDAVTDIVFNSFSIIFPVVGYYFDLWWLDPVGALFLVLYIIHSWSQTAIEHIQNLTGTSADPEDRQVVLYLCMRFAESVKQITALSAYHAGDNINVEVDIVLDSSLNVRDSHDIGEAIQYAIETLPMIERAFVHLDYRVGNFPGHLPR